MDLGKIYKFNSLSGILNLTPYLQLKYLPHSLIIDLNQSLQDGRIISH